MTTIDIIFTIVALLFGISSILAIIFPFYLLKIKKEKLKDLSLHFLKNNTIFVLKEDKIIKIKEDAGWKLVTLNSIKYVTNGENIYKLSECEIFSKLNL